MQNIQEVNMEPIEKRVEKLIFYKQQKSAINIMTALEKQVKPQRYIGVVTCDNMHFDTVSMFEKHHYANIKNIISSFVANVIETDKSCIMVTFDRQLNKAYT